MKVILDAMKRHKANANVQENGCAVLRSLASNEDNQKTIAKMGGIKVILDAMKRHEVNADVQKNGCDALGKACDNDDNDGNKKKIAKMGPRPSGRGSGDGGYPKIGVSGTPKSGSRRPKMA